MKRLDSGFTLIELMIAVAIIAIARIAGVREVDPENVLA